MVADHGGGGADEGGVDGGEEVVAAVEGVTPGVTRSGLARGAAVEDVVEVGERLRRADATRGGDTFSVLAPRPATWGPSPQVARLRKIGQPRFRGTLVHVEVE